MNLNQIFVIFGLIFVAFCELVLKPEPKVPSTSRAFRDVFYELFVKDKVSVDIAIIQASSGFSNSIHNEILAEIKEQRSYRIFSWSFYPKAFKFLIYIHKCDLGFLTRNIKALTKGDKLSFLNGRLENYEFIIVNDNDLIHLLTIEWFTDTACNQPQLIVLNSFNTITQKWNKTLENYEKFVDFHGCMLKLGLIVSHVDNCYGSMRPPDQNKETIETNGIIPEVFRIAAQKLKFTPALSVTDDENDVDVYVEIKRMTTSAEGWLHMTSTFLEIRDIIVATPGERYTAYEKLWLPFDETTWILLISTFLLAFIGIFVVNYMPKFIQQRVFGEKVQTPALNVISTFFGISQYKLPIRHIPRFILMMFVFFCLIFRTCYQSKLFEFMTKEPRHPPPKTVADLKARNYTVYSILQKSFLTEFLEYEESMWPNVITLDEQSFITYFMSQSQNATAKLAFIVQTLVLDMYYIHFSDRGKWHKLPNFNFQVSQSGFFVAHNNFMFEPIDNITQKLISAGIMNYLVQKCSSGLKNINEEVVWSSLVLSSLKFGFVIWIECCGVCCIVFVVELLILKLFKGINTSLAISIKQIRQLLMKLKAISNTRIKKSIQTQRKRIHENLNKKIGNFSKKL
ncbi:unnamed protein product [Chironomus riparius]|uniref:Ionotropic receptor n=1 Tax=Chironomus riparius TaxID=315576 RepID=A0A9N9WUH1_9DIPT|nr:unnamed protein product [Chironomus riparius]